MGSLQELPLGAGSTHIRGHAQSQHEHKLSFPDHTIYTFHNITESQNII